MMFHRDVWRGDRYQMRKQTALATDPSSKITYGKYETLCLTVLTVSTLIAECVAITCLSAAVTRHISCFYFHCRFLSVRHYCVG